MLGGSGMLHNNTASQANSTLNVGGRCGGGGDGASGGVEDISVTSEDVSTLYGAEEEGSAAAVREGAAAAAGGPMAYDTMQEILVPCKYFEGTQFISGKFLLVKMGLITIGH